MTSQDPDPAAGRLEAGQVRAMFDRIAGVYDLMNTAMTAGLHHRWRARAVDLAEVEPGDRVLDVATGTGDLAIALCRRVGPTGEVVACDFAEGMLARARAKGAARSDGLGGATLRFELGDALDLTYPDDSFAAATVGFGARNFDDLGRGLREMARVVAPGGHVVVLEITTPTKPPLSFFYRLWFDRLIPALGGLAAAAPRRIGAWWRARRDSPATGPDEGGVRAPTDEAGVTIAGAYSYLPSSVRRFPSPSRLAEEMARAGCRDVRWLLTAGGIIAIHVGTVSAAGTGATREQAGGGDEAVRGATREQAGGGGEESS